jgi:anaerobic ribonucleoside-triphosphate reductase
MDEKNIDNCERTECEIWTRVMGYYRPVAAFNKGKRSEYDDRKCFKEVLCVERED